MPSARFHDLAHYQATTLGYRLLPFRFMRWNGEVLLVNDVGEYIFIWQPTFQSFVTHALGAEQPEYDDLKAKHFLIDGTSTLPITLLATKYRSKKSFLDGFTKLHLFVVTLRCDHSCPYCQVSRVSMDRSRFDMSPASAFKAVDLVFQSPAPALKIEFQGGEPLLNFDLIKSIVAYASGKNREGRKELAFVIATKETANWTDYPNSIDGFQIIGERTLFIRPEWEWPREERYRGLLIPDKHNNVNGRSLASKHELTYRTYLEGIGQEEHQLIVWNREELLMGPSYRWMGINSKVAEQLGWAPSDTDPFHWLNSDGALMVKSVFWRDGWIDIAPPRFESLGEGWLVLATPDALDVIRRTHSNAHCHLWIERQSHGKKPYSGSWHLISPIGRT